ncbi:MAG: BON domain-containing protein [Betaproteobacteria bacterium]
MKAMKKITVRFIAAALLGLSLSACAPLIIGGAAGTVLVATDRRTAGTQLEDEGIELRSKSNIRDQLGTRVRVNVTSYNRVTLLTGEVANAADKQAAERIVANVQNVRSVVNELAVLSTPSLWDRSNDLLITGKVKAAFIDKGVLISAVKVVTERSVVYLMGRVTARESEQATDAARSVSGVQRVVRMFELVSQQELDRQQQVAAPKS